jgi:hypothetical protein
LERTKQALKLIRPKVGVDLLIYTPEEFSQLTKERRFFREEIMAKEKSYERGLTAGFFHQRRPRVAELAMNEGLYNILRYPDALPGSLRRRDAQ